MPSDAPRPPRDAEPSRDLQNLLDGGAVASLSDAELLARFAARRGPTTEEAFAALVVRHGELVRGVCRRILSDATDAEDAFQGTFLILVTRARALRLDGADSLARWLHGVARRVAARTRADRARRPRRAATERHRLATQRPPVPEPSSVLAHAEVLAALDDEVARLPEAFRAALILCDLGDLTHEQAALTLGCPVGTVKSRLARGRDRLRDRLAARGFRPESAASGAFPLAVPRVALPPELVARVVAAARTLAESRGWGPLLAPIRRWLPFPAGGSAMVPPSIVWPAGLALALGLALFARPEVPGPASPALPPVAPLLASHPNRPPQDRPLAPVDQAPAEATVPASQPLRVEVRDLKSGSPVVGHRVHLRAWEPFREADATTDNEGLAHFTLEGPTRVRGLDVGIGREAGLVPLRLSWEAAAPITPSTVPPDHLTLRVEAATTLTGRVVDPAGRPVAGASVVYEAHKAYADPTLRISTDPSPVLTDAEGRWTATGLAAGCQVFAAASHPLHRSEEATFHLRPVAVGDGDNRGVIVLPPRGTPVDGVVVDPTGRPVAGAAVYLGGNDGYGYRIPPVPTDEQGRFHLGVRPGTTTTLTATLTGFGPTGQALSVGDQPQQVTLNLPTAATIAGRVETKAGQPIAGATVVLAWQPGELGLRSRRELPVNFGLQTDSDGRFAWSEAPAGPIRVEVDATGFTGIQDGRVAAGLANRLVLREPTRLVGRVLDAATGGPITDFRVADGAVWRPGEPLIWQNSTVFPVVQGPGTFTMTAGLTADRIAARVAAPDYYAEETEPILADGETHEVTIRLTRGESLTGRIVRPDGAPATGVVVHLNDPRQPAEMTNGTLERRKWLNLPSAIVGVDGGFRLPPERVVGGLVVADPTGVVVVPAGRFQSGATLTLQPWARVEGTCRLPDTPPEGFALEEDRGDLKQAEMFPTAERIFAPVDAAGRFQIDRLTPGRHRLGRYVPNGPNDHRFVRLATVELAPGSTTTLAIGARGRAVVGRVAVPDRPSNAPLFVAEAKVERATGEDRADLPGIDLLANGHWRINDLAPGRYRLTLDVREAEPGRPLVRVQREFTVPDGPTEVPLDLGSIEPEPRP